MNTNFYNYCHGIYSFKKFISRPVKIGDIILGNGEKIRLQTMTNTPIEDINATVLQCKKTFDAGADFTRISIPHIANLENLKVIKKMLIQDSYHKPIIADVHFNPIIAQEAAKIVEKVRINPGNYVDKKSKTKKLVYSDFEYNLEIEKIHSRILPLIKICKEYGTAVRIGSNHGSLSDRILIKYGNTIDGMVEAAMEFLRIFVSENFYNIVVSMKASDARVMTQACRLLNAKMMIENMNFPQHLGVTEAGADMEGRLKSSIGIGALLSDGIGDTIRVSLTEDPEKEILFAKKLTRIVENKAKGQSDQKYEEPAYNPYITSKKFNNLNLFENKFVVISEQKDSDITHINSLENIQDDKRYILDFSIWDNSNKPENVYPLISNLEDNISIDKKNFYFILIESKNLTDNKYLRILENDNICPIFFSNSINKLGDLRSFYTEIKKINNNLPLILMYECENEDLEDLMAELGLFPGAGLIDNLASGIWLSSNCKDLNITSLMLDTLQAIGIRFSKAEFVSCPGCGRTNYNLEELTRQVKLAFSDLKGIKIAVMGCIVNGPGEMADADYGCVGAGKGKVHIYRGKDVVMKNVDQDNLTDELRKIIEEDAINLPN